MTTGQGGCYRSSKAERLENLGYLGAVEWDVDIVLSRYREGEEGSPGFSCGEGEGFEGQGQGDWEPCPRVGPCFEYRGPSEPITQLGSVTV